DEEIYIDDNNFSSMELEIIDKNNDNKYLTESVDSSFYETEESEEETNEPEIANTTTLLGSSTYSTISFMLPEIKVLLQNCKPKASDYENYQIESKSDNINFDDITTIFDKEEIIVDYDYDNKIEITIDAKKINVNESIETKRLVYKIHDIKKWINFLNENESKQLKLYEI
ncbi:14335_t:CDS:2, partial [Racocetra persica]